MHYKIKFAVGLLLLCVLFTGFVIEDGMIKSCKTFFESNVEAEGKALAELRKILLVTTVEEHKEKLLGQFDGYALTRHEMNSATSRVLNIIAGQPFENAKGVLYAIFIYCALAWYLKKRQQKTTQPAILTQDNNWA